MFTTCGHSGYDGPTTAQCDSAYASSNVRLQKVVNGVQIWTVPRSGVYSIVALGAQVGRRTELIGEMEVLPFRCDRFSFSLLSPRHPASKVNRLSFWCFSLTE